MPKEPERSGKVLNESEEIFRTINEQSFMGILIIQDNQIKYINNALLEILGFSDIKTVNCSMNDVKKLIHPENLLNIRNQQKNRRSAKGNANSHSSYRVITKSGVEKWVEQYTKDILYKGKQAELATIIDISDKKEIERLMVEENRKLSELSQIREELIARVSHELKIPLSSIYAASQLLLKEFQSQIGENPLRLIEMIYKSSKKLKNLIENLLDISKVELGKLKLELQNEDLVELIKECITEIQFQAINKEVGLFFNHQKSIFLNIDRVRISQVVINILANAIKFTPSSGEIFIELTEDETWVDITINDTGIGLTKKEKEILFQKFGKIERKDKKLESGSEGTGLGLYISKEIVDLHKGKILVNSKGRSKGSTFIIKLPKN